MKEHSNNFETEIKTYGRQQAVQVIFEQDGQQVVLDNENVFSATPNYKASLLKSAMKSLILDCNVEIPVGTRLQFKYGILVNNAYEYLNFGYYIVNKIEKKEDARSYEITCYDKMMLTMVDYIDLEISYPITIRNYIAEICNYLEIDFGSYQDQFVNYDKQIPSELYLDENGNSLEYTFRDVLDELSQVTASIICIDENDQLVVKYPQRNGDYETIEGTSLYIENADDSKINLELQGNTTQDGTPTPDAPVEIKTVTGKQVVTICKKNIFDKSKVIAGYRFGSDGELYATTGCNATDFIPVTPSTNYDVTWTIVWDEVVCLYDINKTFTRRLISGLNFTTEANEYFVRVDVKDGHLDTAQIAKGTSEVYEPYQGKDYEVNLGKNLLKLDTVTGTKNGVTYNWEGNKLTLNGTTTAATDIYNFGWWGATTKNNDRYLNPGTYILSIQGASNVGRFSINTYYETTSVISLFRDNTSASKTLNSGTYYSNCYISILSNQTFNNEVFYIQLEKNNVMSSYSPYFTPIELNKIGDCQDFIRKGIGKNLFDISLAPSTGIISNGGFKLTKSSNRTITFLLPQYCEAGTYTISFNVTNSTLSNLNKLGVWFQDSNGNVNVKEGVISNGEFVVSPEAKFNRLYFFIYNSESDSATITTENVQLEKGNQATYFEPYGYKDKWYIEKNVGKVVLNGSETWSSLGISGSVYKYYTSNYSSLVSGLPTTTRALSTHFKFAGVISNTNNTNSIWLNLSSGTTISNGNLSISINDITTANDFKTWLQSNNTTVYYVLANPTYTLIENEELIEQLDRIYLQQGLNNVLVNGNLPSTLKMTYVSDLIGIDEEQLKDINVNFGEKYGPINSLVIARAADSDFIYKEDEKSVAEDGLCEVKISDNQILNDDNRTQFIDEMFNQLRGTEFYLNDFSSTGITYLDLLDYYKVKVFDNYYKCLMLNDEINITQGLQEQVFTERPKESETEYKSIAKQDKDIRKIGIIVNKVEGEITAEIIARQDTDEKVSNLTQTIGEISTTVSTTTTQVEDLETRVYTNETSISQNADSITATISRIQQTEDDVETLQTNTEDVVNQLVFGDDGLTISAKGTTTDDMKLNLTNDAIKFLYQNNAILTINGSVIEFSNASFKKLDLGNYVWQAEDDDSLSLIYEGE